MSNSLIPRAAWASAVLAAAVLATGCSSHGGSAGGPATSAAGNATTASTGTPTATGTSTSSATGSGAATGSAAGTTATGSGSARAQHSSTLLPVPTTAVAAPSGGSVTQTVPARSASTLPSTALASPAKLGTATVQLKVTRITVKATAPGDVSGPALQVVTTIRNNGSTALSTSSLVVNVTDAANTPASPMTSGPFSRMATTIPAGKSATGTYVFHIATVKQPITATVYLDQDQPTAVFTGKV